MSKKDSFVPVPHAAHDFYKSNGMVHLGEVNDEPSMTRQEFAAECDINTIMQNYDRYLSDPMMSLRAQNAQYVDFVNQPATLMDAMALFQEASDAFYRLPAVVRREFDNNPALWADYAADPKNIEQMRAWGLAKPEEAPPAPMKVEVVNPPSPPEAGDTKAPQAPPAHVST